MDKTVKLADDTKEALDKLGKKNDSYDDVIQTLLPKELKR